MQLVEQILHRIRYAVAIIGLLLIVYGQLYFSIAIPAELNFALLWQPDNQLQVVMVDNDADVPLQTGDYIVAIDGRTLHQTEPVFVSPIKSTYQMEIERHGERLDVLFSLTEPRMTGLYATTVVSLLTWAVGILLLQYRIQADRNVFRLGMIFIFLGTLLTIIQGSTWGVPGMWISHGLTHYALLAFVLLGMLPRRGRFGRNQKRFLQFLFGLSTLIALVGLAEVLFLFPSGDSLMRRTGFSWIRSGYLALAAGMLMALIILIVRWLRASASYQKRQLAILLFFVGLGVLPAVLLTIVPQIVIGRMLVSRLLTFSLLLFVPVGYLFVVYRQGHLKLDFYFGRIAIGTLLALSIFTVYSTLWDVLSQRYGTLSADGHAALAVAVFLMAIVIATPLRKTIETIFYGQPLLTQQTVDTIVTQISEQPHRGALQQAVMKIVSNLNIARSMLLLEMDDTKWTLLAQHNVDPRPIAIARDTIETFTAPMLRLYDGHTLFDQCEWSELLLPIVIGDEQIGVWLLSIPQPQEVYDSQLIGKLMRVANAIAISRSAIQLFESTNQITGHILHAHASEQHMLASQIHDHPLANVILTRMTLQRSLKVTDGGPQIKQAIDNLQTVIHDLRKICRGLRIDSFDQGLDTLTKDVIVNVCRKVPSLMVNKQLADSILFVQASQTTKMAFSHILQESLNNAVRHANAAQIDVTVDCDQETVQLEVRDNGSGGLAIEEAVASAVQTQDHYGLYLMQRWAQIAQGLLFVSGNEQGGVTVVAKLKLQS